MHVISSSWVNENVITKFQSVAGNYMWNSSSKKKEFHLIGWNKVLIRKSQGGLGIRDLGIMKFSIHDKKILSFLNKEKQLWSRVLISKYKDYHPWLADCKSLRRRIGDGADTNIWSDPWFSSIPICKWPTFVNTKMINGVTSIKQLIKGIEWDLELMLNLFGEYHYNNIIQIYIPKEKIKDRWVWSSSNELSCKSAYNFIVDKQRNVSVSDINWNSIWNLKTLPRVKFHLKLSWDRLPTTKYLSNISKIALHCCFVGGKGNDDIKKILMQCPYAISRGENMPEHESTTKFKHMDLWHTGKWLLEDGNRRTKLKTWMKELIAASFWQLWKNRNSCCFNNKKIDINIRFCKVLADIQWKELQESKNVNTVNSHTSEDCIQKGHCPHMDKTTHIISCDAAWMNCSSKTGFGFNISELNGKHVAKGSSYGSAKSPLEAEIKSIWLGVLKAKELKLEHVFVKSDRKQAIDFLNKKLIPPWNMQCVVMDILAARKNIVCK
ncbi:hypothetical protein Cni_G00711 [Canna indica]|uniref:RNase H type-1 domain-containing protein n=1 Tax=Canna indica TaxID=4628 RepID=A0AAQ3PZY3_9LILI|nr:hypothetical protein Cni_G00711 [Canna indica]